MSESAVAAVMDEGEARRVTDEVKRDAHLLWVKLLKLYEGKAHVTLGYASWAEYCREEFNVGKSHAYRLLEAGRVAEIIDGQSPVGESPPITHEAVARELVPLILQPSQLREVMREATSDGKPATAAAVREAVRKRTEGDPALETDDPELRKQRVALGLLPPKPKTIRVKRTEVTEPAVTIIRPQIRELEPRASEPVITQADEIEKALKRATTILRDANDERGKHLDHHSVQLVAEQFADLHKEVKRAKELVKEDPELRPLAGQESLPGVSNGEESE